MKKSLTKAFISFLFLIFISCDGNGTIKNSPTNPSTTQITIPPATQLASLTNRSSSSSSSLLRASSDSSLEIEAVEGKSVITKITLPEGVDVSSTMTGIAYSKLTYSSDTNRDKFRGIECLKTGFDEETRVLSLAFSGSLNKAAKDNGEIFADLSTLVIPQEDYTVSNLTNYKVGDYSFVE